MKIFLLLLLLLNIGCEGRNTTYTGTITALKFQKDLAVVTLDTLSAKQKSFGAIGHGEVWMFGVDHNYISSFIGKRVVITGSCDGWACRQVKITEL